MTSDDHPITPPQWLIDDRFGETDTTYCEDAKFFTRWGADEQLAICLKWLQDHGYDLAAPELKEHCRPFKPQPPKTVVVDGHTYHLAQ